LAGPVGRAAAASLAYGKLLVTSSGSGDHLVAAIGTTFRDGRENGPVGRLEARAIGTDFRGFLRPSRAVMPPISR
jgi:hypothetical protein